MSQIRRKASLRAFRQDRLRLCIGIMEPPPSGFGNLLVFVVLPLIVLCGVCALLLVPEDDEIRRI
jgi:hypothetical protein